MTVTTENVMTLEFDEVRKFCFDLVKGHEDAVELDVKLFVAKLGEYAAQYQYFAELFTFLVGEVRKKTELKDSFGKMNAMDRRDCVEWVLKVVKMHYDSLSRKATVLAMEDRE